MVKEQSIKNEEVTVSSAHHDTIAQQKTSVFHDAIKRYIQLINTQDKSLPVISRILSANAKTWTDSLIDFVKDNKLDQIYHEEDGHIEEDQINISYDQAYQFQNLAKELDSSIESLKIAISNIMVAIVSLYDSYFAELIRLFYKVKPNTLDTSNKQFSAEYVLAFNSIDDFRNSLIEKEVETILRDSHTDQIEWLEKKLEIPLKKGLSIYPSFVEITERRNLFVHANGRVSKQYINECKKHGVAGIKDIVEGEILTCSARYAQDCYSVFFEIGVKLGVVMWHKLKPEEYMDMYKCMDSVCYTLICEKKYDLALSLLDFMLSTPFKKDCPYAYKLVFAINKALIFHLNGDKKRAFDIASTLDCSAAQEEYKMAVSILKDDHESAISSMKKIGADSYMRVSYRQWPLFTSIRDSDEFQLLYKQLYEEDYYHEGILTADFDKLIRNALDLQKSKTDTNP